MSAALDALNALDVRSDRVVLDNLVLRLQSNADDPQLEVDSLAFYKSQPIIDEYRRLLAARPEFAPKRIVELGIWDGGSTVFWNEVFDPDVLLAIDLNDREDSPLFERYLAERGATSSVRTQWRVDQADRPGLHALLEELGGPIDLVVDDASHLYEPTRASFEALFPFVRPGGLYVIEDWPWAHLPAYRAPDHPWRDKAPLTRLVHDLVELLGSCSGLVANIDLGVAFAAVERGYHEPEEPRSFDLDRYITRSE